MTVTVDPFGREDLADGAGLYRAVFNEPPWNDAWTVESARTRLEEILETPGYRGYRAAVDGDLVGLALGRLEQWHSGRHCYLEEMCVRSSEQRRGIGTRLLDRLTAELRAEGVERVYLLTMRESPARAFYEANGFESVESMGMQALELAGDS